jgi:N,N'-diacetylbacillosaminyl-diphospho-undecaprenol alpha-1,3-N-acetylgalactosaminyltransferase
MRVAIVIPDGLSATLFCSGMMRALCSSPDHEVAVISDTGEWGSRMEELGARSIDLKMHRYVSPLRDAAYVLRLARILRREQFDAVVNFSTKPNIYGPIAARLAGCRLVVGHVVGLGSTFVVSEDESFSKGALRFVVRQLYRLASSLSDAIWFTNKNDLQLFREWGLVRNTETLLTRSYLDVNRYSARRVTEEAVAEVRTELGLEEGDLVVLMIARMIWAKGIREFVEAAVSLHSTEPSLHFVIVAPPEDDSDAAVPASYVDEHAHEANLHWLGFRDDVEVLIGLCDLAVLPSYYREGGYPRALLEPMAMDKPVVAADTVDCRGPVNHGVTGYLVPPRDSGALAAAIAKLAADPDLRREFGANARQRIETEFDEDVIVPKALRQLGILSQAPQRGAGSAGQTR